MLSCPRKAPGTARLECVSAKNIAGFFSICLSVNPSPVSLPFTMTPVRNGPWRQPIEVRQPPVPTGLGKAMLERTHHVSFYKCPVKRLYRLTEEGLTCPWRPRGCVWPSWRETGTLHGIRRG